MRKLTLLVMLVVALAVPPAASAQGSCNANGYSNVAGIQSNGTNPACTVTTASSGNLPFTGLDLGIVLGAGVLLIGSGLLLRRMSGSRQN